MSVWKTADFDLLGGEKMNFNDLWISGMSRKKKHNCIWIPFNTQKWARKATDSGEIYCEKPIH